ncbi:hypothetical protein SprV_0301222400 [Sparganum proliferum]
MLHELAVLTNTAELSAFGEKQKTTFPNLPLCAEEEYNDFVARQNSCLSLKDEMSGNAIRPKLIFGSSPTEALRKSAISWFHGAGDKCGGRPKRREAAEKQLRMTAAADVCPNLSPTEDKEPATATERSILMKHNSG